MRLFKTGCLLLTVIALTSSAMAQTTVYRDKNGNRTGSVSQQGSQSVERDKNGNRIGSFANEGGQTVYRDAHGNRTGSSSTR